MDPDALLLEPSATVESDPAHHSKPPPDAADVSSSSFVDNASPIAAAASSARRRGRSSGRTKSDSALALPSFIWDYFVKDASGKFVICTLCPSQTTRFAYSGGTSTMNRHLRQKHQKYAPGKSPADYDRHSRGASYRRHGRRQPITASSGDGAPAASAFGPATSTSQLLLPSSSSDGTHQVATAGPGHDSCGAHHKPRPLHQLQLQQQQQLVGELRIARRRVAASSSSCGSSNGSSLLSKRLASDYGTINAALASEFDAAAASFGSMAATCATATSGGALQFPVGFELHDAGMDAVGLVDPRFGDCSSPLPGAAATTATTTAMTGSGGLGGRGRRLCAGSGGTCSGAAGGHGTVGASAAAAASAVSLKMLTHRLLQFLIAQYEPLDVSHVSAELGMLFMGGVTEWPKMSGPHCFGYGGASSGYGASYGMGYAGVKLPSEETLKLALANLYYSQRGILKEVVADVEVLSLSLNNWTSAFGQNVLSVSGHWISRGFRRRDCVLEVYVLPLDERVNTIALLRDVMEKWDIPSSKVAALTMRPHIPTTSSAREDDLATLQSAAEVQAEAQAEADAIHSEYPGLAVVRCFVEELEGAVSSGLRACADLTRRCRTYVSYFIQNPSEYQIFLALQRNMSEEASATSAAHTQAASFAATADGVSVSITESGNATIGDELDGVKEGQSSYAATDDATSTAASFRTAPSTSASSSKSSEALPVICDFDDRWNSTTEMMCRIVQLEPILLRYKMGLESDTNPARRPMQLRFVCCELSPEEWATLKQLARLLDRIEGLVHVSPHVYAGLSLVYPLLHSLKKHLADAAAWVTDPLVATVRDAIVTSLNMDLCSSGQTPSSAYLSCLFDPRFKTLPFLSTLEKEQLVDSLYELLGVHEKENVTDDSRDHLDPAADENQTDEQKKQDENGNASSVPVDDAALPNKKTAALLHEFFPLDEPATEIEKVKAQVQQYLDSPSLPATDDTEHDPLEWWGRYRRLFPRSLDLRKSIYA
uniref:BED-type domain-containing protein n=1 Tax=Peronospora matthiolae TaxID=2874970 RepID=A0AAV1V807_9STRA